MGSARHENREQRGCMAGKGIESSHQNINDTLHALGYWK